MNACQLFVDIDFLASKLEKQAHGGFIADPTLLLRHCKGGDKHLRRRGQHLVIINIDFRKKKIVVRIDICREPLRFTCFLEYTIQNSTQEKTHDILTTLEF